jgi:hypothetical protein
MVEGQASAWSLFAGYGSKTASTVAACSAVLARKYRAEVSTEA